MSNIMEEDQTIKEDACHRPTPAKGLSEMCVESACFVGLDRGYSTTYGCGDGSAYSLSLTYCEPAVMPMGRDFISSPTLYTALPSIRQVGKPRLGQFKWLACGFTSQLCSLQLMEEPSS